MGSRLHAHLGAQVFNLFNHRQVSAVTQRAYLVGTTVGGVTPLIFQDAAAIAAEGLNTQAFGTPNGQRDERLAGAADSVERANRILSDTRDLRGNADYQGCQVSSADRRVAARKWLGMIRCAACFRSPA